MRVSIVTWKNFEFIALTSAWLSAAFFFYVSTLATAVWLKLRKMFSNRSYKHAGDLWRFKQSFCEHWLWVSLLSPQIYQEDMMRSLLQNSLHVFRAISGTSTDLG